MGHPEARTVVVGEADATLDERLTRELDVVNRSRTPEVPEQRELTVRVLDAGGALLGGVSGWTWDEAAGIGLTWVDDSARGRGVGTEMLAAFETEASARGARRVFVTSFTFQAPAFYERHGYVEFARWAGVPRTGSDDVHLRKDL